jgi:hypothetical protein
VTPGFNGVNSSSSQLSGKTPEAQDQDASAGASAYSNRSRQGSETPEPASVKEARKSQGEQDPDRSKAAKDSLLRASHAPNQDGNASSSRHRDGPVQTDESLETPSDNIEAANLGHRHLEPPENTHRRVSDPSHVPDDQVQVSGAAMETHESSPGHSSNTLKTAVNSGSDGEPGEQNVSPGHSTAIIDPVDQITDADLRGFFVHHYFDFVAGTSTGG